MRKWGKRILVLVLFLSLVGGGIAYMAWRNVSGPAVSNDGIDRVLFIPSGCNFDQLVDSLQTIGALGDARYFKLWADRRGYKTPKSGRYEIKPKSSINELVLKLRSGDQDPVRVTFNNVRRVPQLAEKISKYLEVGEKELKERLEDPETMEKYDHNEATFPSMFIPNTYEFWWNTSADKLIARLAEEHERFWSEDKRSKAASVGLSTLEVSTLASIVQEETNKMDEAPRVAGVYMNRLKRGMALQADPTLKFALGMDSISRVLDRDKLVDSPYNTYLHPGLPPGPINLPDPRYINAVLNYEQHKYLYFCAKEDLSGYSNFAKSYAEHLRNARRYQRALDQRGIYR